MMNKAIYQMFKKTPLALAMAGAVTSAQAIEYNVGELNIQLANTVSYGIGWRVDERDRSQIMPGNGNAIGENTSGASYNYDDGTLNYDQGDIYTNVFKWSGDLEMSYRNYGGFFRARAYYDHAIMDQDTEFKQLNEETENAAGRGAELLDAFVWADYDINYVPVTFRLGRQVLSWGESTFIQGGINSVNPVDASAFRKPGAELKEGLLPVNMFYTSIGLTGEITLEAFYQLEWDHTRSDPCGTFFSTVDFVADGCGPVILGGTADERDILALRDLEVDTGVPLANRVAPVTERIEDEEPSDSGQYGMAVRWYSEALGDTEFGFYYMNIHSRLPYINGVITNQDRLGVLTGTPDMEVNEDASYNTYRPLYQIAYPEDIKIAGVSFARSTASGASISGEISYKPDMPVQWNAFELILAGNGAPWSRLYQQRAEEAGNAADLYGEVGKGYDEFDIWQAQSTYIMFFDRVLGADRLALVGEVGATYIPDLPDTDDARYGRSGAYGIGNNDGVYEPGGDTNYCIFGGTSANVNSDYCTDDGYTTKLSGGIRLRSGLTYNNAFAGVNMTPNLSIAYDKGYGPEPGSQFIDDRLTVGLGVSFLYLNQTSVDVSYTNFSGGKYNQLKDRDNISLSAKYSF
ncbi:MAG: peptide ABC transporter substrate-binding protein [Oceanospirillaceae bacterium]|nr:peptide ABC transporter substrate-binding protein [Oceanospirillaceae bacterium]